MGYYFSIFLRRLHYFLLIAVVMSAVSIIAAFTLPPAFVSQMRLLVESPRIPSDLASSTVNVAPLEQLQIVEQRLLTRSNLLAIARDRNVLPNMQSMSPDQIVSAMRSRTRLTSRSGRDQATLMSISFEAPVAQTSANVLNDYLTLIQQEDAEFRRARAGDTLVFFEQEVDRLGDRLNEHSERILQFKTENSDALPERLSFRLGQQSSIQERLTQIGREINDLTNQRERMVRIFNMTGSATGQRTLSPEERQLEGLQERLTAALAVYSPENPRVKILEAQISQAEQALENRPEPGTEARNDGQPTREQLFDLQLMELDTRVESLVTQRAELEERLGALRESLEETPRVAATLEELERTFRNIQGQYNTAVDRLARASTGERIEVLSRGQRISVVEPPSVPSEPTKPNRILIAGGGSLFGLMLGLALVVLIEVLNRTPRRPDDLVRKLEIWPVATIPYIYSGNEVFWRRSLKVFVFGTILLGVPAAIYAVHLYYLPLDLIADRLMNKIGVRW